jgi:DNA helicase-2/ATP-dependent DNA helicase PcrA
MLKDSVLVPAKELTAMYEQELRALTPALRLQRMALRLESMVDSLEKTLYRRYEEQYASQYSGKKLQFMVNMAVAQYLQQLRADIRRITLASPETILADVLSDAPEELREAFRENREAGLTWWEDAVFQALFSVSLGFAAPDRRMRHLLIDEAQDYPEAALALLRRYYPRAEVTVLGDPKQRTCPGMPACDPALWADAMDAKDMPVLHLNRSYRSTLEINAFANSVAGDDVSESFGRHGDMPEFISADPESVTAAVQQMRDNGLNTIAILTRTPQAAQWYSRKLKNIYLLDSDDNHAYEVGDTVLCCYHMAKGMEFDGVIVIWPDCELTDGERRRIYTASTRALHTLKLAVAPEMKEKLAPHMPKEEV